MPVLAQTLRKVAAGITSPYIRSPGTGRPKVNMTRKPFVAPQIKEEASLVCVTLISGNGCNRDCQPAGKRGFKRGGNSRRRGNIHGGRGH